MTAPRRVPSWGPAVARVGYGLLLLFAPGRVLALGTRGVPAWADPTVRILGARHVLQALALAVRPEFAGPGAIVDLAHASTDVACAVLRPELRVPALFDTAVAAVLAGGSWSITCDADGTAGRPRFAAFGRRLAGQGKRRGFPQSVG